MKKFFVSLALVFPIFTACNPLPDTTGETGSTSSSMTQSSVASSEVQVFSPSPNARVTSPLVVAGKARGSWFFEANIPVSLLDDKGNLIAETGGQALGEWMTTDFVDFKASLSFSATAKTGKLVIKKDNPSGLPENDGSFEIPITF